MTIFAGSPIETMDSSSRIRLFNINDKKLYLGAFVGKADEELLDLFIRLLKLNDRPDYVKRIFGYNECSNGSWL
ncbi:hypothetical protein [Clostridium beijerinckii]|uniref:hypothetical protein n=1 Tax=Clostridium beijerinckii TaxID=1520 RepID=UPI0009841979|nr:hypothetical protein [Clostridium beijerinckii]NRX47727.1 hypothetical protein [Clostridium beijerinckii]NRZ86570.1 hypothetical protein [Clostridium beijerinckii]NSA75433.1 hypothetical protein [Clostridium beijerinckii]NSB64546.1 hypothetical protein [Clostridium beijerinckii]